LAVFRIALLSDIHAGSKEGAQATGDVKLYTDGDHVSAYEHPLYALHELIKVESLKVDAVVCPGDMTNRAEKQALNFIWRELNDLKNKFSAHTLVATVGNHDVDSRNHSEDGFPREHLMRLVPPFPSIDPALSNHYWAHGYYITEVDSVRFLVVNSCWLHEARDELARGVVTSYTLDKLKVELSAQSSAIANVAVMHHHPHAHSELGLGFDDVIRNGQILLQTLEDSGSWLVVHGHKHHPKIELAQGQYQSPVVLACGSFSGRLEGANASVSRNYFHIVEIDLSNSTMRGRVISWAWMQGTGWKRYSDANSRFPSEFGFGRQQPVNQIATDIQNALGTLSFMNWRDLTNKIVEINFLMPKELRHLIKVLEENHGITVLYDTLGLPYQIGTGI